MTPKNRPKPAWIGRDPPSTSSRRKPLKALGERQEENKAWRRLQKALSQCLLDLDPEEYLIVSYIGANYYVQFAGEGSRGLLAEAACNTYIEPPTAVLTESQYSRALKLGWQPATDVPPERRPKNVRPRGSPNFFVKVGLSTDYGPLARLAIKTLREVYRIPNPGQLEYKAFSRNGASIRFPTLGLPRRPKGGKRP